jgi:hypothetical protein
MGTQATEPERKPRTVIHTTEIIRLRSRPETSRDVVSPPHVLPPIDPDATPGRKRDPG